MEGLCYIGMIIICLVGWMTVIVCCCVLSSMISREEDDDAKSI